MTESVAPRLKLSRKQLVTGAELAVVAVAIVLGLITATHSRARSQAQNPGAAAPAFEVASIKPNKSGTDYSKVMFTSVAFSATGATLRSLIGGAHGFKGDRILGAPNWVSSEEYDVEARMDKSVADELAKLSPEQRKLERNRMLQVLFEDRFKLSVHWETKELPIYVLVIAKHGPKLQVPTPGDTYKDGFIGFDGRPAGRGIYIWKSTREVTGQGVPIAYLVKVLSIVLKQTVVDKTGLTGNFDYKLLWSPEDDSFFATLAKREGASLWSADASLPEPPGPSIFTAIQEQLGLKLESQKGPAEVLIIDHVEKPSEN
jgi:uncharacterized protein (TIGR03435 family)